MTHENHQQAIESKNENYELGTVFLNRESGQETKVHFLILHGKYFREQSNGSHTPAPGSRASFGGVCALKLFQSTPLKKGWLFKIA